MAFGADGKELWRADSGRRCNRRRSSGAGLVVVRASDRSHHGLRRIEAAAALDVPAHMRRRWLRSAPEQMSFAGDDVAAGYPSGRWSCWQRRTARTVGR